MENKWILILLLSLIGIGIFYLIYENESKTDLKGFIGALIKEFLGIVATFFFGFFGFSWDQFIQKNNGANTSEKN